MKIVRAALNRGLQRDVAGFRLPGWMCRLNRQVIDRPWFERVWRIIAEAIRSAPYGERVMLPAPVLLTAELTSECGRGCRNCCSIDTDPVHRHLPVERLIECVAELDVPNILLSGGDPIRHPEIDRIVEALHSRNLTIATDADASLVGSIVDRLRLGSQERCQNVAFLLSIYGGERRHDDMRWAGSYRNLLEIAKILRSRGVRYSLNCVLSDQTAEALAALAANHKIFSPWKVYVTSLLKNGSCRQMAATGIPKALMRRRLEDLRRFVPGSPVIMAYPSDDAEGRGRGFIGAVSKTIFGLPIDFGGCGANAWMVHLDVSGSFRPCPFLRIPSSCHPSGGAPSGAEYWQGNRRAFGCAPICADRI